MWAASGCPAPTRTGCAPRASTCTASTTGTASCGFSAQRASSTATLARSCVADGKEAWIGGLNVGDEYMGRSKRFGPWRDTHVRIKGPAVLAADLSFREDWQWATGEELTGLPTSTGSRRRPVGADHAHRPCRQARKLRHRVRRRDRAEQGAAMDRQPLFRARRVDGDRTLRGRDAGRRCAHPHP